MADVSNGDSTPRPAGDTEATEAFYLYCLAHTAGVGSIEGTGVDGEHPLMGIPLRDVTAVVSLVRLDTFCGPAAEARMRNLKWLAPRAYRHEEIIEQVMRLTPVFPARFATLFSTPAALLAWLEQYYDTIRTALERYSDHQEWAVRATVDRCKAEGPLLAAALARSKSSTSPGLRYLEERRIRANIGQEVSSWLGRLREELRSELCEYVVDFRERALGAKVSDDDGSPLLNWAFLVATERLEELQACVRRFGATHAAAGVVLDCSGPWPPYSFSPALEPSDPA